MSGLHFRKSINIGGVRFNLSKSGISTSVGVKGFRVGTGPRGNYIHMGRNGVYYRASLGPKRSGSRSSASKPGSAQVSEELEFRDIESSEVAEIVDSTSQAIIDEIMEKRGKVPAWLLALLLLLIPGAGVPLAAIAGLLLFYLVDKKRKSTILLYDIDEDTAREIQSFYDGFEEMMRCSKA